MIGCGWVLLQVAGAALDVFESEPKGPAFEMNDSIKKLVAHKNFVCTPHLGQCILIPHSLASLSLPSFMHRWGLVLCVLRGSFLYGRVASVCGAFGVHRTHPPSARCPLPPCPRPRLCAGASTDEAQIKVAHDIAFQVRKPCTPLFWRRTAALHSLVLAQDCSGMTWFLRHHGRHVPVPDAVWCWLVVDTTADR